MKHGKCTTGHPVDVATGAVYLNRAVFRLRGKLPLYWERRYSTQLRGAPGSPLGIGWTAPFYLSLRRTESNLILKNSEGGDETFDTPSGQPLRDGELVRHPGTFQELRNDGDGYSLTRWHLPDGDTHHYRFDLRTHWPSYLPVTITNSAGHAATLNYDDAGRLLSVTQLLEGRALQFSYDARNRLTETWARSSRGTRQLVESYHYDSLGRLTRVEHSTGATEEYCYDAQHRLIEETTAGGGIFTFVYDDVHRCVFTAGDAGFDEKRIRYFPEIGWTTVEDSHDNEWRYEWRDTGQVTRILDPTGALEQFEYDEHHRQVGHIAPNGAATSFHYDERGNRIKTIDPLGREFRTSYDDRRLITSVTAPNGACWHRQYDGQGRLAVSRDPLGHEWHFAYDRAGNLCEVTDPRGNTTRRRFDDFGSVTEVEDWSGSVSRWEVDEWGYLSERTSGTGRTTSWQYDFLGRLLQCTLPDGRTYSCEYTACGRLQTVLPGTGERTHFRYDGCGRLVERRGAVDCVVKFRWGSEPDELLTVCRADGRTYDFAYDSAGRVVRESTFESAVVEHTYTAGGLRAGSEWGDRFVRYERDAIGRVCSVAYSDGACSSFEYDLTGQVATAVHGSHALRYERDLLGRVVLEDDGSIEIASGYDEVGNRTSLRIGDLATLRYGFDESSRVTRVEVDSDHAWDISRDRDGLPVEIRCPGGFSLSQRFNRVGWLVEQHVQQQDPDAPRRPAPVRRRFAYDAHGLLANEDRGDGASSWFDHDEAKRLRRWTDPQGTWLLEYDAVGNVKASQHDHEVHPWEYDNHGRVTRGRGRTFEYDASGFVERIRPESDNEADDTVHLKWDARGCLRSLSSRNRATVYAYDAFARRIEKRATGMTLSYVWDGDWPLAVFVDGGKPELWLRLPGHYHALGCIVDGDVYTLVSDPVGLPRELLDRQGVVCWRRAGQWMSDVLHAETALDLDGRPFGFPGMLSDAEAGIWYNRYRYYDAILGRYLSPDPTRLAGGFNSYSYVRSPLRWVDVLGLDDGCDGGDGDPLFEDLGDDEIDAAFDDATAGTYLELPGQNPRTGEGLYDVRFKADETAAIAYHENMRLTGIQGAPSSGRLDVRRHSANANAPAGSYSAENPTTQINRNNQYMLPNGQYKPIADMTPQERAACHFP